MFSLRPLHGKKLSSSGRVNSNTHVCVCVCDSVCVCVCVYQPNPSTATKMQDKINFLVIFNEFEFRMFSLLDQLPY